MISTALNTLFVGRNLIKLVETDSTNNHALLTPGLPEGTVVCTDFQTGGRGQRGKSWASEPGKNLLCSILLRPSFVQASRQFSINKAIACAVRLTIQHFLPDQQIAIKWPNDIYAGNRKLAGILTETQIASGQIVSYVTGIGINLNQEQFGAISPMPASLKIIAGKDFDRDSVLAELCNQVEAAYLMLKRDGYEQIDQLFQASLWKRGENIRFRYHENELTGRLIETDRQGRLVVMTESGLQYYQNGDIVWVI